MGDFVSWDFAKSQDTISLTSARFLLFPSISVMKPVTPTLKRKYTRSNVK